MTDYLLIPAVGAVILLIAWGLKKLDEWVNP